MFKVLAGVVTVGYPIVVYLTLDRLQTRYLALTLAAFFLLRWLVSGRSRVSAVRPAVLAAASGLFLLAVALADNIVLLLGYPVFVSLVFFTLFFFSILHPPTVVEKLARLRDPDLTPRGVAYTRKVTIAWCCFFLLNALIASGTVWYGERWIWGLYNGCISYLLVGILMGAEMLVRKKVMKTA